jgi:hypothetical protein
MGIEREHVEIIKLTFPIDSMGNFVFNKPKAELPIMIATIYAANTRP